MIKQQPLTLVSPVRSGCLTQLSDLLRAIRTNLEHNQFPVFEAIGTIHYARLLLLNSSSHAKPSKDSLVFSTDYDGSEDDHLTDLATKMSGVIDDLFSLCEGYPAEGERNTASRRAFLAKSRVKSDAFYIGAPGRTLKQIREESRLRDFIWTQMKEPVWAGKTATEVHRTVRERVLAKPEFEWVKNEVPGHEIKWVYFVVLALAAIALGFLNYWILISIILIVVGWLVMLHFFYELKDKPLGLTPSRISEAHIRALEEYEDLHNQNQFSQLIPMKPGKVRTITVNALMLYARFRIHVEFVKGKLMGIPTIHFARWLKVDGGRQMLFFSNFDGSWQQYLGDFIDKSGWGLTAIFSNTENFPVTRYLFWGGAYDEEHFLAWSRYYQIPTAVWYCAYPELSIKNVNNNTCIRQELVKDLTEAQAQVFLKRF